MRKIIEKHIDVEHSGKAAGGAPGVKKAQSTTDGDKKKVHVTGILDTIFGSGNCNCKKKYEKKVRDYEYELNKAKQNVKGFSDKAMNAQKELQKSEKKYWDIVSKNTELEKANQQLADQYIQLKQHFDNEYEIR